MWGDFFFLEAVDKVLRPGQPRRLRHSEARRSRVQLAVQRAAGVAGPDISQMPFDVLHYGSRSELRGRACFAGSSCKDFDHVSRSTTTNMTSLVKSPSGHGGWPVSISRSTSPEGVDLLDSDDDDDDEDDDELETEDESLLDSIEEEPRTVLDHGCLRQYRPQASQGLGRRLRPGA